MLISTPPRWSGYAAPMHMIPCVVVISNLRWLVVHQLHRHGRVHCSRTASWTCVLNRSGSFLAHRNVLSTWIDHRSIIHDAVSAVIVKGHGPAAIIVMATMGSWADKLWPVAAYIAVSTAAAIIINIDSAVALHQQTLTFLPASFDDARGSCSVSIAADRRRPVHLVDVVFGPGSGQVVCDISQTAIVSSVWSIDLVERRLDKPWAALMSTILSRSIVLTNWRSHCQLWTVNTWQVWILNAWLVFCVQDLDITVPVLVNDIQIWAWSSSTRRASLLLVLPHPVISYHTNHAVIGLATVTCPLVHVLFQLL